jgi:hypothetical protein
MLVTQRFSTNASYILSVSCLDLAYFHLPQKLLSISESFLTFLANRFSSMFSVFDSPCSLLGELIKELTVKTVC